MYALLIHDAQPEDTERPDGEEERMLVGHRAMQAESIECGELKAVSRLAGKSQARTLRRKGEGFQVTDGPYLETKEWLVGLYLLECDDEPTAIARAEQICPPKGSIEIRPVTWQRVP